MQIVQASLKEHFDASIIILGTSKSHHFIPQTKSKLLHTLTSEDNTRLILFQLEHFRAN